MSQWLLIDDSPEEANAFAANFSCGQSLSIHYISATDAVGQLSEGKLNPAGVLMDVDLSNELGRQQTGPGMAQSIRVAQQRRLIPSFPLVRFSLRQKVLENIGSDSSSDDLFDLKIEKDGLSNKTLFNVARSNLVGVRQIYDVLERGDTELKCVLNLSDDIWTRWGSSALQSDFEAGDRVYLQASPLIRLMVHPGLLIDEGILGFRLGVDRAASAGWAHLQDALSEYVYSGVAADCFRRWWARGIEQWWQEKIGNNLPLAATDIGHRVELLNEKFGDIVPLAMPKGSMGDRPWRYCLLTKEQRYDLVPVDPARGVKIKPRSPMPLWLDPLYASLGMAMQNRDDPRLDKSDLKRLLPYTRSA